MTIDELQVLITANTDELRKEIDKTTIIYNSDIKITLSTLSGYLYNSSFIFPIFLLFIFPS